MFGSNTNPLNSANLKGLDIAGIANKLINLAPDGKGKAALNLALGIAREGGSPKDVKTALENMMPGAKEKLAANDIWKNLPDDKDAIVQYGQNVAKQFQLFKN